METSVEMMDMSYFVGGLPERKEIAGAVITFLREKSYSMDKETVKDSWKRILHYLKSEKLVNDFMIRDNDEFQDFQWAMDALIQVGIFLHQTYVVTICHHRDGRVLTRIREGGGW